MAEAFKTNSGLELFSALAADRSIPGMPDPKSMLGEGSREQQMHNLKNAVLERVKSAVALVAAKASPAEAEAYKQMLVERGAAGRGRLEGRRLPRLRRRARERQGKGLHRRSQGRRGHGLIRRDPRAGLRMPCAAALWRAAGRLSWPSREYTRTAVSWNSAAFSAGLKPAASRLKLFQSTRYEQDTLSTGKLLSNMQRSGPKRSMVCRT